MNLTEIQKVGLKTYVEATVQRDAMSEKNGLAKFLKPVAQRHREYIQAALGEFAALYAEREINGATTLDSDKVRMISMRVESALGDQASELLEATEAWVVTLTHTFGQSIEAKPYVSGGALRTGGSFHGR